MLIVFIRTFILFAVVVFAMRVMGKRQIGQLQPFELAVAIMISELAALPMQSTGIPLANGLICIFTLMILQVALSFATMKSSFLRSIICGKPVILIENGKILEENLEKEMFGINDLLEKMRIKNVPNIADVEFAVLETNGDVSIVLKSQKRPINPEDINIPTKYEGLPLEIIIDGKIIEKNLMKARLSEEWVINELKKFGIEDIESVLLASLDTDGNLFYQKKNN